MWTTIEATQTNSIFKGYRIPEMPKEMSAELKAVLSEAKKTQEPTDEDYEVWNVFWPMEMAILRGINFLIQKVQERGGKVVTDRWTVTVDECKHATCVNLLVYMPDHSNQSLLMNLRYNREASEFLPGSLLFIPGHTLQIATKISGKADNLKFDAPVLFPRFFAKPYLINIFEALREIQKFIFAK